MHPRPLRLALALAVALVVTVSPAGAVPGQQPDDPALDQTIDRDQEVVSGPAELASGHVDLGPRLEGDELSLLVHDDASIPAVWRALDDVVIRVSDEARQTVPDDPTYAFLGVDPGADVHIVPQIERRGVVWLGWNTQDPALLESLDRGATLRLVGVEGPGALVVYLQAGALGEPDVLWDSSSDEARSIWVEINTHTHANWVFTEPGPYLVHVEVAGDTIAGEPISTIGTLRFAVGDDASADEVRSMEAELPAEGAVADGAERSERRPAETGGVGIWLGLGAAALVLGAGVAVVVWRGAAVRRRAVGSDGDLGPEVRQ